MTHGLIRQMEALGYSVTVHETAEYLELRAAGPNGDAPPIAARCENTTPDAFDRCALRLAEKVGIKPGRYGIW
jgi:hypothetical protein